MTRRAFVTVEERLALWRELGATLSTRPVCPECARFIHPALWDAHMTRHHEDRVGLAEEAMAPPVPEVGYPDLMNPPPHNEEG